MRSIFSCALLCMTILVSCNSHSEHHAKARSFKVSTPYKTDTTINKEYVCQIHSFQHIELRALERGYLEKIFVDEGQFVKKGQVLFQIMPRLYQAELERATAEANFAKIEYLNTKSLADSNVVGINELAMAKAKYDKAKAELSLAEVHLQFTKITAPFDGYIDRFHVRLGSLVEEGDLLSTLADNSEMWVYFNVPEAEYLDYKSATKSENYLKVGLKMANNQLFPYSGQLSAIEADFNNETGNIAFRATFPNPEKLLRHGETGTIVVERPLKQALLIPQKSSFEILDKRFVYVVTDSYRIEAREISIAAELPHLFAIDKGLQKDDKILLDGLRLVKKNDEISWSFVNPIEVVNNLALYAE